MKSVCMRVAKIASEYAFLWVGEVQRAFFSWGRVLKGYVCICRAIIKRVPVQGRLDVASVPWV